MTLQKTLRNTAAFTVLTFAAHNAAASGPDIRVSGFGTVGYVTTNTDAAEFRNGARQHKGATDSSGDWGVDSRLGLQANAKFTDIFSVTGQLFAARRDGDYRPDVEWLFGQANVNEWASLRVGRMVLPTFLLSDSREVGYAQHWVRAPAEAYQTFIPSYFDGVQGLFRTQVADYNLTVQVSAGRNEAKLFDFANGLVLEGDFESDRVASVNLVAERGDWAYRVGHTLSRDTEISIEGFVVGKGDDAFTSLGLQYDNGSLLVMSEYIMRRWDGRGAQDGAFDSDAYYLSSGYRFGSVMPYATFSHFNPDGVGYGADQRTRKTTAIGVRWDAISNVALKAQFEEVRGSGGFQFLNTTPAFAERASTVRVISVAADFVF